MMLSRRFYSDSAKARQLLKNAFERMQKPGYVKSDEQRNEIMKAARKLDVAPSVAEQAYASTIISNENQKSGSNFSSLGNERAARKRAVNQIDIDMYGPPQNEQYISRDFEYDDVPSAGHLQFEEMRDLRQLTRVASYESPLLAQYRTSYNPEALKSHNLRFQHYAFPNEQDHPAVRKVVLSFTPESVENSSEAQQHKLKSLAGRRYDSSKNEIRFGTNRFSTQAQNKRYLVQTYEKLVQAAKEDAEEFKNVPVDQRHVLKRSAKKDKPSYTWRDEWNRRDSAPKPREDIYAALETKGFFN